MGSSMDVAIVLEVGRHKMLRRTVEWFRRVGPIDKKCYGYGKINEGLWEN